MEQPSEGAISDDNDDLLGEDLQEHQNRGNLNSGPPSGFDSTSRTSTNSKSSTNSQVGGNQHTQKTTMACEEVIAASEVYKILIQKGLVDREGAFEIGRAHV